MATLSAPSDLFISRASAAYGASDCPSRILASHYRPEQGSGGPSWLTFIGHLKDSLWSIDLDVESQGDLLSDPWTAPAGIAPLCLNNGFNEFFAGSFWAGLPLRFDEKSR